MEGPSVYTVTFYFPQHPLPNEGVIVILPSHLHLGAVLMLP